MDRSLSTAPLPSGAPCCEGYELVLVGTAPQVGPFPELRTYRCRHCGHIETVEAGERAGRRK